MGLALLPPVTKFVHFLASAVIPGILRVGGIIGGAFKNPYLLAFVAGLLAAVVGHQGAHRRDEGVGGRAGAVKLAMAFAAANPLGLVIIAVAALAVGIAVLWERSATFRKIVEGAFHGVLSVVQTVWTGSRPLEAARRDPARPVRPGRSRPVTRCTSWSRSSPACSTRSRTPSPAGSTPGGLATARKSRRSGTPSGPRSRPSSRPSGTSRWP